MLFMNTYEIDDACNRFRVHPILGPATQTLANLRDAADANSDGWAYWPKPGRAAKKLMTLILSGRQLIDDHKLKPEFTKHDLLVAYAPVKAFRTRSNINFEIVV